MGDGLGPACRHQQHDRDRCLMPAMREQMDPFTPRRLTEDIMCRHYQKHNPTKLDDPNFLKNVMTLSDEELRSRCLARYHVAPV